MISHRTLTFAFAVAMVIVAAKLVLPADPGIAYRILDALYWLSASYVPGYFVYLLVVYLPRRNDQQNLSVFIANQSVMLTGDGQHVLSELAKAAGYTLPTRPTLDDVKAICLKVDPHGPAPLLKSFPPAEYATWLEFMLDRMIRSRRALDALHRYLVYLDSNHVRLVNKIEDCTYFMVLDGVARHGPGNRNLDFLATSLHGYFTLTAELAAFLDKRLKGVAWSEPRV